MEERKHTMPGDGLPQALFDLIALLEARIAKHFRGTGLHWGLRRILQQLWIRDGLSQAEIAQGARISQASASNMLKHLVAGGWVERRQDEYDYRISRIYVAGRGLELKAAVEKELAVADETLRKHLKPEEAEELRSLVERAMEVLPLEPPSKRTETPGIWDRPTPPGEL
jgi:DNA-binding MarR family transcriptional regulator